MSDPVTNDDIEDVLSSIRRLVSDESIKGMPRRRPAGSQATERFVLTPAFRVPDRDLNDGAAEQGNDNAPGFEQTAQHSAEHWQETAEEPSTPASEPNGLEAYQSAQEWEEPEPEVNNRSADENEEHSRNAHSENSDDAIQSYDADAEQSEGEHQQSAPDWSENATSDGPEPRTEDEEQGDAEQRQQIEDNLKSLFESMELDSSVQENPQDSDPQDNHDDTQPEQDRAEPDPEVEPESEPEHHADASEHELPKAERPAAGPQITLEQRIAELEAALASSSQEWEPDGSEEELTDETRPLSADMSTADEGLAKAIASVAQELEAEQVAEDMQWQSQTEIAGPAPIETLYRQETPATFAELTPEPAADSDAFTDHEESGHQESGHEESGHEVSDHEEADHEEDNASVAEVEQGPEAAPIAPEPEVAQEPEPAPEPEVAAEPEDNSLSQPVHLDVAEATVEWKDLEQEHYDALEASLREDAEETARASEAAHNTAAMNAAAAAASAAARARDNDLFAMDDAAMLDEEALQELVADMVRQELQGVLGERITRNVRRLVRREIKRALAMRDLE